MGPIKQLITFIPKNLSPKMTLDQFCEFINLSPKGALVLAPELFLAGYEPRYLSQDDIAKIKSACKGDKLAGFTCFSHASPKPFNKFMLFNSSGLVYERAKAKLFLPNDEDKIFTQASDESVGVFEYGGLKIGVLICFELRFIQLWQRLKGADIILVPALWGQGRQSHFKALCAGLAVASGAYVLACSGGAGALKLGAVFAPDASVNKSCAYDENLIKELSKTICKDKNG